MNKIKFTILAILAFYAGYTAFLNKDEIQIFIPWPLDYSTHTPAFLVYIFIFLFGCLFTLALFTIPYLKKARQVRILSKELKKYTIYDDDMMEQQ